MARLPRERADWHAVRHMYEIGRAPENAEHPDYALARDLARGLWANLPWLDPALIVALSAARGAWRKEARRGARHNPSAAKPCRLALGRIACGYDGGQSGSCMTFQDQKRSQ